MLHQHNQLLLAYKSIEARVVDILWVSGDDCSTTTVPDNVLSLWKKVLQQSILARQLDLNVALTKSSTLTTRSIKFKAVDRIDSLLQAGELDIAIKSLTGDALHNDMNGLVVSLGDEAGIAT